MNSFHLVKNVFLIKKYTLNNLSDQSHTTGLEKNF